MDRFDIEEASDALLSLRSTDIEHGRALAVLERLVTSLALQQPPEQQPLLDAFLALQDSFQYNCERNMHLCAKCLLTRVLGSDLDLARMAGKDSRASGARRASSR